MIKWILTKIVGTKNQREVRRLRPIVEQIVSIEESWNGKGQEFLLEKTREWQGYLHRFLPMDLPPVRIVEAAPREELEEIAAKLNARFESLKEEFASLPTVEATPASIEEGKAAWNNITPQFDKLRERYLNQILPEAFAAVKHGARLLCGEERDICGQKQVWDMVHFDVQLLGGIALHRGYIAEMATGEGKTLVATLPVYLNALTGMGVHVVTVNDYLARRDSEWMGMLFQFLGLTVGCIQSMMPSQLRREQYACDITYGTNAEFGFDYLRDNGMATSKSEQVQRGHYFSIVDEVDSILIDEARTPLIISGPAVVTREQQYDTLRPAIERVVKAQTDLCNELMAQALKAQEEGRTEEVGRCLFKVKMGQPRHRAFLRAMQDPELRRIVEKYELTLYQDTRKKELYKLKEEMFFTVDEKTHDADLMEKGREVISPGHPEDFVLPDLGTAFAEMDEDPRLTEKDKLRRKNELTKQLDETGARLHTTSQLLKAYCIYEKDVEYVVKEGKVIIIDQNTGREMPGRRWSDGLHQAVEAKEGVEVERENQTYATITIQNYFRLYKKLAGMTGTAETEAAEFHDIYKLDVLPIPTNRPCIRKDQNDLIFKSRREKFNAVVNKIQELHDKGQPILIGTASVDASETLSRMLKRAKIPHEVLNAKNHQREAEIVAQAGKRGAVTVSTNMAGRGTDIKLSPEVKAAGGLAIIGTERHESRRVDRQLRGRAGRQGDPGSSVFFVSLEDDLMRLFSSDRIASVMDKLGFQEGEMIEHKMISNSIERAQKKVEENNFGIRKRLLEYDDVMNKQRTVVYTKRRHALMGERIGMDIVNMIWDRCAAAIENNADYEECKLDLLQTLAMEAPFTEEEFRNEKKDKLADKTFDVAMANFKRKTERLAQIANPVIKQVYENQGHMYENILIPITDGKRMYNISCNLKAAYESESKEVVKSFEKSILLHVIDESWKENLRELDELKHSVQNASYEQKDPLLIYKLESVTLFDNMVNKINNQTVSILMRGQIPVAEPTEEQQEAARRVEVRQAAPEQRQDMSKYREQKQDLNDPNQQAAAQQDTREAVKREPIRAEKTVGRNDPCPCGSGKKYKNCHGRNS